MISVSVMGAMHDDWTPQMGLLARKITRAFLDGIGDMRTDRHETGLLTVITRRLCLPHERAKVHEPYFQNEAAK